MTTGGFGAGWYPDGEAGWERWWDGVAWTSHRREVGAPAPPAPPPPPPPPTVRPDATTSWPLDDRAVGWAPVGPVADRAGSDLSTGWARVGPVDGGGGRSGGVLAGLASAHERQRWWNPWIRVGWWMVLAPVAVACWAAGLAPGGRRFAGFGLAGFIALVYLAALTPAVEDGGREEVAADVGVGDEDQEVGEPVTADDPSATATSAPTISTPVADEPVEIQPLVGEGTATSAPPSSTAAPTTAAPATTAAPTTTPPPTTAAAPTTAAPPPTTAVPPPTTAAASGCHPAYSPCIPNQAEDLNCDDLSADQKPVTVYNPGVDPYGLDSDNNGEGCESG